MSKYIYEHSIDTVVDAEVLVIEEVTTGTTWRFHFNIGEYSETRDILLRALGAGYYDRLDVILSNFVPINREHTVEEARIRSDFYNMHKRKLSEKIIEDYFTIKHVNFKGDSTIVIWKDGSKTSVTCQNEDVYSKEVGIAMCVMKRAYERMGVNGGKSGFNDVLKNVISKQEEEERKRKLKENKKFKKQHCKSEEITVAEKIIEKAKTVGVSTDVELSEAWCHDDRIRTRRDYVSIKFVRKEDRTFNYARVTDYFSKIQYDIFEHEDAMYISRLIKSKDYKTARFWLCNHFTTPEVML